MNTSYCTFCIKYSTNCTLLVSLFKLYYLSTNNYDKVNKLQPLKFFIDIYKLGFILMKKIDYILKKIRLSILSEDTANYKKYSKLFESEVINLTISYDNQKRIIQRKNYNTA
jgi:hypothetical protein